MARIRAKETTTMEDAAGTSIVVALPTHQTNDLLIVGITRDNNREDFTAPGGWSQLATIGQGSSAATTNAIRSSVYYKIAASSSETDPTFTIVNGDEMVAVAVSVEGADTVTPFDMAATTSTDIATPVVTLPGVTTATNNALVFHYAGSDTGALAHPPADWITVDLTAIGTAVSNTMIASVQQTAGAVSGAQLITFVSTSDDTAIISFAVRDGSSGNIIQAYPLLNTVSTIEPLRGCGVSSPANYYSTFTIDMTNFWWLGVQPTTYNPTSCWQVTAVGPVYTSMLTQASNDTQGDVLPFPASEAVGDYFTVGYSSPFRAIVINRAGAVNGVAGVVATEYWNGSAWAALTDLIDTTSAGATTSAFRGVKQAMSDGNIVAWAVPSNWATLSLNGESADYKIRYRITTVYTTNPTLTRIKIITDASAKLCSSSGETAIVGAGLNFNESGVMFQYLGGSDTFSICAFNLNQSFDLSSGLLAVCFYLGGGTNFKAIGNKGSGGSIFGLVDGTTGNNKYWTIASSDADDTSPTDLMTAVIQPSQSINTASFLSASAPVINPIDFLVVGHCSKNTTLIRTAPFTRCVYIPSTFHICGGGTGTPLTWDDVIECANCYEFPLINRGSNSCIVPLQFGGSKTVKVDASIFSVQFLQKASLSSSFTKTHVDDGYLGIVIDGRSGDVINLTFGTILGGSKIRFEMLATCSASATYDFRGLTIVNANVTMRPMITFSAMSFINCTSFVQNQTDFSGCSFSGSTITCDKLSGFSDCSFACESEHAIVLGASLIGSHVFNGNTFSGYGADGSSTAAIYNNSGGLVTIQLSAGDSVPTVKNGAGSSTVVALSASYTVENIISGSRLLIRRTDTQAVLINEVVAGTSRVYTYNYTANIPIEAVLRKASSAPYYQEWRTTAVLTSTSASVTANQLADE